MQLCPNKTCKSKQRPDLTQLLTYTLSRRIDPLGIPTPFPEPQAGSLRWGPEPSQQCKNFFDIIVLQFVGCPLSSYRFGFTMIVPLLLSPCNFSFVLGCGVSFLGVSSVFLQMIVQQLVAILVLSQKISTHSSTLPS